MDLLAELDGINLGDQVSPGKPVSGRVAHIDADFMTYIVAADTVAETNGEKPKRDLGYKFGQVMEFARFIAGKARASEYVLHVTGTGSTKGGRYNQVVQQEYQASRGGRDLPADFADVKSFIGSHERSIVHMDQEADDGMTQANYADPKNAIICSADKDLRMVPGLHLDMNSYEVVDVPFDAYGSIEIDDSKSSKKIVGYGPAFFFAQCLTGDAADTIKGLPAVYGAKAMALAPTQAYTKAVTALADLEEMAQPKSEAMLKHMQKYRDQIEAAHAKTKPCGPVMAYELLKDVRSVKDALHLVDDLFMKSGIAFTHWQTGEEVTPRQAYRGDMFALWMRRNKNPEDVLAWLRETVK
jgi:hypothetical protein